MFAFFYLYFCTMSTKTINIIKGLIFICIALYLAFTFNSSLANFVSKVPFVGWVVGSITLRLVISFAFARGVQLVYKLFTDGRRSFLVLMVGALLGFTIVFIAQPIYSIDYGNFGTQDLKVDIDKLKEETNNQFDLNSKPALVVYFSTNCGSCIETANKIGELQLMIDFPQVIALFPGTLEDATAFMNENKGANFKYHMIDNDIYFQEAADYGFPSIFLVDKNGETVQHWEGSLMNFTALDMINKYN